VSNSKRNWAKFGVGVKLIVILRHIIASTFPQLDDLIKHSRENHPYHCYYCKTTFVLFEEVI
jgi:PP-loop superfamily ATP-utilizing enzyme